MTLLRMVTIGPVVLTPNTAALYCEHSKSSRTIKQYWDVYIKQEPETARFVTKMAMITNKTGQIVLSSPGDISLTCFVTEMSMITNKTGQIVLSSSGDASLSQGTSSQE